MSISPQGQTPPQPLDPQGRWLTVQALIDNLPLLIGLATGVILFLVALVQGLVRAPDLITPADTGPSRPRPIPSAG